MLSFQFWGLYQTHNNISSDLHYLVPCLATVLEHLGGFLDYVH